MIEYNSTVILKDVDGNINEVIAPKNVEDFFVFLVQNDMWTGKFDLIERYDENEKAYYIFTLKYEYIEESINEQKNTEKSKADRKDIE